ncbi:hypothetical protein CMUS01_11986 [Colletotrichum musicola]|uniref:Uncharacterized protein n=1 Tax=Colletotrichum musicola TaxID=2175873 RepID=A0A8H6N2M5_9PEZI|nr:hypothetical protein CMUS01_11986 [Colletotrichum musicola]
MTAIYWDSISESGPAASRCTKEGRGMCYGDFSFPMLSFSLGSNPFARLSLGDTATPPRWAKKREIGGREAASREKGEGAAAPELDLGGICTAPWLGVE